MRQRICGRCLLWLGGRVWARGLRHAGLSCVTVAAGVVPDSEGAEASLRDVLAAALDANREMARLAAELREENGGCARRTRGCGRRARSRRLSWSACGLTWPFCSGWCSGGRQSGRGPSRLRTAGTRGRAVICAGAARAGRSGARGRGGGITRICPGVEVAWDFGGGGYCCPEYGTPFTGLGSDHVTEQLDWLVIVRVRADCRRRYRRACSCRVPATVTAPGPSKAIGKGLFTNAFIAMLFTERFVAGRSMNSLVTALARHGADVAGHAGRGLRAGRGAAGPAGGRDHGAVAPVVAPARRRDDLAGLRAERWGRPGQVVAVGLLIPPASSWTPPGQGPSWARHAGIDEKTGQLTPDDDDGGPRRLVISSDFYAVYQSAGMKAGGLVNLYCWAHIRRYFVRAGDANPAQLGTGRQRGWSGSGTCTRRTRSS